MVKAVKVQKNPRFLSRYVRLVGVSEVQTPNSHAPIVVNGDTYKLIWSSAGIKAGSNIFIAKFSCEHRSKGYTWTVHEVTVPESEWHHMYYQRQDAKYKRVNAYVPWPDINFKDAYIVELVKKGNKQ